MRRTPRQLEMTFRSWGGKRQGAGRPRLSGGRVPHRQRAALASRYPVHVTLKVVRAVRGLRAKDRYRVIRRAFVAGCVREGFRITDWSVMGDHLHLIVEAKNADHLARGMQGFKSGVARRLNRLLRRSGTVFAGRYHSRMLKTPREVRNALAYVMNNARRHGYRISRGRPDLCSSWADFDGWQGRDAVRLARLDIGHSDESRSAVSKGHTWLRRMGWRKHHRRISVDEKPGPAHNGSLVG